MLNGVSCTSACTAVGEYFTRKSIASLVERWNGRRWALQPTPHPTGHPVIGVSCASATACIAVGASDAAASVAPLAEGWNGASWVIQPTPSLGVPTNANTADVLLGVSCSSSVACTAVGTFEDFQNAGRYAGLVEHWDGAAWTLQQAPAPAGATSQNNGLRGVSCASSVACTAVGSYSPNADNHSMPLVEQWDGTSWTAQQTPPLPDTTAGTFEESTLTAVSCTSPSVCFAVGGSTYKSGGIFHTVTLAERSSP